MGIDDRDYMRERRVRWDERSGGMRHDEEPTRTKSMSRWWIAGTVAVGLAVLILQWWPRSPSDTAAIPEASAPEATTADARAPVGEPWAPEGPVLVGRVLSVTDGDTIKVELASGPIEVRFHSIDTPERAQPWGREAKAALAQRLQGAEVALEPFEQDRYGRMIAVVYLGDVNVNAWLVQEGHAWVYRQYARDERYCQAEGEARAARRGLWALPPAEQLPPWEWRAVKDRRRVGYSDYSQETVANCIAALGRPPAEVAPRPLLDAPSSSGSTGAGGCRIKGNIGSSGKVYHLPGSPGYANTQIDESKGERWFCTEDEARAAGWRAPRG